MTERKNAKAMAGGSLQDRMQAGLDLPLQGALHQYIHPLCVCVCVWRDDEFCKRHKIVNVITFGAVWEDSECFTATFFAKAVCFYQEHESS